MYFYSLLFDLDEFIAFTRKKAAEKRQTLFLGAVRAVLLMVLGLSITVYIETSPLSSRNAMINFFMLNIFAAYWHNYLHVPSTYPESPVQPVDLLALRPSTFQKGRWIVHQFFNHIFNIPFNYISFLCIQKRIRFQEIKMPD